MKIAWTPFHDPEFIIHRIPEDKLDEDYPESVYAIDGTDDEFYHFPWADAEDGQVFACEWSDGTVKVGRREDDAAVIWQPEDQGKARAALLLARKCWLYNTIEALQKELTSLGGWDG